MNACGYGVGKPDCEYSLEPLSIEWRSLFAKVLRSVLKGASVSSGEGLLSRSFPSRMLKSEELLVVRI